MDVYGMSQMRMGLGLRKNDSNGSEMETGVRRAI